jgi:hypothetical protein
LAWSLFHVLGDPIHRGNALMNVGSMTAAIDPTVRVVAFHFPDAMFWKRFVDALVHVPYTDPENQSGHQSGLLMNQVNT